MDKTDELDALLAEEKETPDPALGENQDKINEEKAKAETELANLKKAKEEALKELKSIREAKQKVKTGEDDELPKIDMDDPTAKAWAKHIRESVDPIQAEVEKAKEERRTFALNQFLSDKPALSKNPEKVKELVGTYERLRTATEMTTEGILNDLQKAYAAVYSDELLTAARQSRVNDAKADVLFSDIAVSRGATSYSTPREKNPVLDEDSKKILAKWGMTPEEWTEDYKKYK
jgi:hypothetical protein